MATPIVRRNTSQSQKSNQPEKAQLLPFTARRLAAWAAEITLVVTSGLVPFGLGVYANSRNDFNRVPLHPVLVVTQRAIARPLALPLNYGIPNVAAPTNFLWIMALLSPMTLSWWQLYLLAKTGSTIPKRKFGVCVVNEVGKPAGLATVVAREGVGRWTVPVSIAYILWRYSFAFPNLGLFTFLAVLMVLGEGIALPSRRGRRAFHDWLAGTYTIDTTHPLQQPSEQGEQPQVAKSEEELARVSMSTLTGETSNIGNLWRKTQQNPNLILFGLGVGSMIAVLGTLVATQVYLQTRQNHRQNQRMDSEKFLAIVQQLSPNSGATTQERQSLILAMGSLNNPVSRQFLTDLLVEETNPILLNKIQEALVSIGLDAIPELKNKNQFLAAELNSQASLSPGRELRQQQLHINQETINKILRVNSGQITAVDLSGAELGSRGATESSVFQLVLDQVDLSGINWKSANLNQASFKGSMFRGPGEDGHWDTYDDAIANLTLAQMKQANFTDANLSRVIMNRSNLSGAILNRANLAHARLIGGDLSSTRLIGANLRGALLEKASLTGAVISEANFDGANLYGARLSRGIAIGTNLSHANLTNTDWRGTDLSGAYLNNANLSNANLSATRLTGAVLRRARLENANLQNADLSFVDLRGANVTGADFQGAVLAPVRQDPTDTFVETPDLGSISAVVQGVDFSQAKNLDRNQIAYICAQGGFHPGCP